MFATVQLMLAGCYACVLEVLLSSSIEALVTRLRLVLFGGLTFGLGSVASGPLKILDSKIGLVCAVGTAVMLGVALIVEAVGRGNGDVKLRTDVAALRQEFSSLRAHMTEIECLFMAMKSSADAALRRSHPDLGSEAGRADRSGSLRSIT